MLVWSASVTSFKGDIMKNIIFVSLVVLLSSCYDGYQVYPNAPGAPGASGPTGSSGHSLVTAARTLSSESSECPGAGGHSLDVYIDTDNSNSLTSPDTFDNSVFACNGVGSGGSSSGSVRAYTLGSSCTSLGDSRWAKKDSNSDSANIYDNSTCSSNHLLASVDSGNTSNQDSSYWLTNTRLAFYSDGTLRVVTFSVSP